MSAIDKIVSYMTKIRSKEELPRGKRSYHRSDGIKKPEEYKMTFEEAEKIISNKYKLVNQSSLIIKSKSTDKILNIYKQKDYEKKDEEKNGK